MFPGQNGNISLNNQSNLTHFHLPSTENERTKVPTFHRFWEEQNRNQFRPDINHRDPTSIDLLNASSSTEHRNPHPVIPHFNINSPPPLVRPTVITSFPPIPWQPGDMTAYSTPTRNRHPYLPLQPRKNPDAERNVQTTPKSNTTSTVSHAHPKPAVLRHYPDCRNPDLP